MITVKDNFGAGGTEQEGRLPAALKEGYFNVDEMTFEDLLAASVDFASELKYFNTSGVKNGNWRSFLASNEIVIMALIVQKDVSALRKKLASGRSYSASKTLPEVLDLVEDLNGWLRDISRSDSLPARDLTTRIQKMLYSSLMAEAHNLGVVFNYLRQMDTSLQQRQFPILDKIWGVGGDETALRFPRASVSDFEGVSDAGKQLAKSAFEFLNAVDHLKSHCQILLPQSLKTESHDPAISVFIAFLRLYRYAQDNANAFTQRHLDFYYREILRTKLREPDPEMVVLNFEVLEHSDAVDIEAGRKFTCAKDGDLNDIIFETVDSVSVSDAKVSALHTLHFAREEMITPACDLNYVTKILRQDIPLDVVTDSQDQEVTWPLFGNKNATVAPEQDGSAEFLTGIAVASRIFFLDEGERKIVLSIRLNSKTRPLSTHIASLGSARTRSAFKESLFAFSLGFIVNKSGQSIRSFFNEVQDDRIRKNAAAIDKAEAPTRISPRTGEEQHFTACEELYDAIRGMLDAAVSQSDLLLLRLEHADSSDEFRSGLGEVVSHFLFEGITFDGIQNGSLDSVARKLECGKSLDSVRKQLSLPDAEEGNSTESLDELMSGHRERLLASYLGSAFEIRLTTEEGWYVASRYDVLRLADPETGFKLVFNLPMEAPAVCACVPDVHGESWKTELPVLRIDINPATTFNAHSLLDKFEFEEIDISARVHGVKNVVVYNNISQLDPSKPFYPFGPTPTINSYLAVASPEAAIKNVDAFRVRLHWGELPAGEEGFRGHYKGYPTKYENESFQAKVTVLNSGSWQPAAQSQIQKVALFNSFDRKLSEHQLIDVESVEHLKPVELAELQEGFGLGLRTRSGFVKLSLASPGTAFGHEDFPIHLSQTLETNSKKRLGKRNKLPKAPYTPLLNKLSVDYIASTTISIRSGKGSVEDSLTEKVYRTHPFGIEHIFPVSGRGEHRFFKPFGNDGNLLIGLSASERPRRITLYFLLCDDSTRDSYGSPVQHHWSYLAASGWEPLRPDQIVSDGTKGFLKSGIVTIDLPKDFSSQYSEMPGELYWLKVSSDSASKNFCSLRQIRTHAVKLRRAADDAIFDYKKFPISQLQWRPVGSIPGISAVTQMDGFTQLAEQENRRQLNTRIAERIRHRSRAVHGWDYERLILEKFPAVGKAVSFPNRTTSTLQKVPGHLLIVVTPRILDIEQTIGEAPRLSAANLNDIHDYVASLNSTFAHVEVVNPVYEWVQVRCSVVFEEYARASNYVELLNKEICQFINPFSAIGYGLNLAQHIRREDIYSFIYNQDFVSFVSDFSMLHISRSLDGYYRLGDSVQQEIVGDGADLVPVYPWSLAVPLKKHYIEVETQIEPRAPEVTGIRELEVGNTFIVGGI